MHKVKLAICQLAVVNDKQINIKKAEQMIGQAGQAGCQIAVLPEMFNCPYEAKLFPQYAEEYPNGDTINMLSAIAKKHKIIVVGGSIPERDREGHIYNTSFIFDQTGRLVGRHRKMHLFDVEIKEGTVFKESETLTAGCEMTVVKTPELTFGTAICYDVRFPELARAMTLEGAQLLIYPAAFGPVTGPAHWELLMRSRAVDNQVFVVGAAPALTSGASYQAYGHSIAVDPWGNVLIEAKENEAMLTVDFDMEKVAKVRKELPLLIHRRPDIYQEFLKMK